MAADARLSAASTFILQSPPGEIDDCFNDIRAIISDDALLEGQSGAGGIGAALKVYNERESMAVPLSAGKKTVISEKGLWYADHQRYVSPRTKQTFVFDHMTMQASDVQPLEVHAETEAARAELEKVFSAYVSNHYTDGVCEVYALEDDEFPLDAGGEDEKEEEEEVTDGEDEAEEVQEEGVPVVEEKTEEEPAAEAAEAPAEDEAPTPAAGDAPSSEAAAVDETADVAAATESPSTAEASDAAETTADAAEALKEPEEPVVKPKKYKTVKKVVKVTRPPQSVQSRKFALVLAGNKYNPTNFWTGRWRAAYECSLKDGKLSGATSVQAHYYEQGNVQLSYTHPTESVVDSPSATTVVAAIKAAEVAAEEGLRKEFETLAEDTFKSLRRALPKTKGRMEWGKIAGYRLGGELQK